MTDLMAYRWGWLSLSLALHILASTTRWLVNRRAHATADADTWWSKFRGVLQLPWPSQSLRMLYGLGLPAAALMWQGALTSCGLGLPPFRCDPGTSGLSTPTIENMVTDTGYVLLIAVGTVTLFACGRWSCRVISPHAKPISSWLSRLPNAIFDALYHQVHWAFYREPLVLVAGITVGSWLGLIPVAAETALNLSLWERLEEHNVGARQNLVLRAALWLAGTLVFIQTRNLVLAILMHLIVSIVYLAREQ